VILGKTGEFPEPRFPYFCKVLFQAGLYFYSLQIQKSAEYVVPDKITAI